MRREQKKTRERGRGGGRREKQWWHKTPKTTKITKKYNGHTRGEFVLIILLKKRGYFEVFSDVNQRYFIPHTTVLVSNLTPRKMKGHVPTRTAVTPI